MIKYREEDCKLIQRIASELGFNISLNDAEDVWEQHSDNYAAGWLIVDNDKEVRTVLIDRFGEVK